ncbi:hypothetical protein [uncultured Bacteroides sp.]|uniref:hypothetical protein n=1 Tax=uncultured Bacteroides sp. TaxID=162156 RepID=UPI0025D64A79|nr:hypothetical protein [uncultured Bacteroides sp.]
MRKNWKLLMLGVTVMFLLQSCVTVRKARHQRHHHRKHCMVISQQPTDTALFNVPTTYMATEIPVVYEYKG